MLFERGDRLLHARDHRLVAGTALGSDNGIAFTSRAFRARLAEHGIVHRRGGYRDPESQAFIESWFSKLKQRCIWREEFETLDQARNKIGAYIDRYHHRPHSRLAYRTPREVARTWKVTTTSQSQRPDRQRRRGPHHNPHTMGNFVITSGEMS